MSFFVKTNRHRETNKRFTLLVTIRIASLQIWTALLTSFLLAPSASAQNGSLFQRPTPNNVNYSQNLQTIPVSANSQLATPGAGSLSPSPNAASPFNGDMSANGPSMNGSPNAGLASSWTYIPPSQARTIKLHDLVSIRVEESATSLMSGNATSRKTTSYDAVLKEWIRLVGLDTIKPAPQSNGDPRTQFNQSEVYRGDSQVRTNESLTFNITAEVVDIKPNGHMVLEASKTITLNDNRIEVFLVGTCRPSDINADNTILSRNLLNPKIDKRENGHVRDGYSRGWLTKFLARIKPF